MLHVRKDGVVISVCSRNYPSESNKKDLDNRERFLEFGVWTPRSWPFLTPSVKPPLALPLPSRHGLCCWPGRVSEDAQNTLARPVPVPRVERTMFAITGELKRKGLVLGECSIAALGFHGVSRAEGPK